jgi:hypothetical protein
MNEENAKWCAQNGTDEKKRSIDDFHLLSYLFDGINRLVLVYELQVASIK